MFGLRNIVSGNMLIGNNKSGIAMFCSDSISIKQNVAIGNIDDIRVLGAQAWYGRTIIEKNVVSKNSRYGISIETSKATLIKKNLAIGNGEFDLYWDGTGKDNVWISNTYRTKNW